MRKSNGNLNPGNYRPEQVKIGAGGLSLHAESADLGGGDAAASGRIIVGNDTGPGPWILDGNTEKFRPGMRAGLGLDYDDIMDQTVFTGCPGVSISPDGLKGAVICMKWVFTCTNLSAADPVWTRTSLNCGWAGNGDYKAFTRKIQIDPNNPDVIYCVVEKATGMPTSGLYRSLDFGATWTRIATVPETTGDINSTTSNRLILCLWRNGSLSSGRSGTVAVMSQGNGVYISTDGGTTFSLSSSSPTDGGTIQYTASGKLLVCSRNGNPFYRLASGTWTEIVKNAWSFICHPTDPDKVWLQFAGTLESTDDEAATFPTYTGQPNRLGGNIGWHRWTTEDNMGLGEAIWAPRYDGIVFPQGIGVWKNEDTPTTFTKIGRAHV